MDIEADDSIIVFGGRRGEHDVRDKLGISLAEHQEGEKIVAGCLRSPPPLLMHRNSLFSHGVVHHINSSFRWQQHPFAHWRELTLAMLIANEATVDLQLSNSQKNFIIIFQTFLAPNLLPLSAYRRPIIKLTFLKYETNNTAMKNKKTNLACYR